MNLHTFLLHGYGKKFILFFNEKLYGCIAKNFTFLLVLPSNTHLLEIISCRLEMPVSVYYCQNCILITLSIPTLPKTKKVGIHLKAMK